MSSRTSYAQFECLVEFLEHNPDIAKGLLRTTQGKIETKRKWENLSTTLNSLGGPIRNGQGWAKYWAEKKCALKKQFAEVSASMRRTGGGPADNLPMFSDLENRLVALVGAQEFATGDARWTVNPFPQSTSPTESPVVIEHVDMVTAQEDMAMDSMQNISPIPSTSQNEATPATSTIPAPHTPLQSATPPRPRRRRPPIQLAVLRLEKSTVKDRVNITKEREFRKRSEEKDEYTMYGELVAMKLKKIENSYARSTAQYHINNILYKAEIGAYDKPRRQNKSRSKEHCTAESSTANLDLNDDVESPRSSSNPLSPTKSSDYDFKMEESDESSS